MELPPRNMIMQTNQKKNATPSVSFQFLRRVEENKDVEKDQKKKKKK